MMNKHFFIWMILLLAWSGSQAQDTWHSFQSPENVNDLLELDGNFWLATNGGVVRLNKDTKVGDYWTPGNSNLPGSHIQSIAVDQSNQLWIGTYDLILARWTGEDWDTVEVPESVISESHIRQLYTIEFDTDNNLWLGTTSGLIRYDGENWDRWHQETGVQQLGDVWSVAFGEEEEVYFAGFFAYKLEGDSVINLSGDDFDLFAYGDGRVETYEDEMWFNAPFNSLARFKDGEWEKFPFFSEEHWDPIGAMNASCMFRNPQGDLYLVTDNDLFYRFNGSIWVQETHPQITEPTTSQDHYLLTYDADGNSWAFRGVMYSELANGTISEGTITELDIYSNEIRYIAEGPDGRILVANDNNNLDLYHQGAWTHLSTPLDTFPGWNFVNDVAYDSDGRLWLTCSQGLFTLEGDTWTHYTTENSDFPLSFAFKISIGPDNRVAITAGNEVALFDGSAWTHYTPANSPLTEESLKGVLLDNNGVLWISTFDQALHRVEAGNWETYTAYNSILPSEFWAGYNMHADAEGNVWIPLGHWGALRIKPDNTWTIIDEGTPLEETFVQRIKTGPDGVIYFQTNLFHQWDGGQEWTLYNEDNTPISTFLSNLLIDSQNRLWCGTYTGIFVRGDLNIVSGSPAPNVLTAPKITAYPNPGIDELNLDFYNPLEETALVRLFDMSGKIVQSAQVAMGVQQGQLNVSALPSGFYYIQIERSGKQYTTPWVKQ